jgi:hypothetical protein
MAAPAMPPRPNRDPSVPVVPIPEKQPEPIKPDPVKPEPSPFPPLPNINPSKEPVPKG